MDFSDDYHSKPLNVFYNMINIVIHTFFYAYLNNFHCSYISTVFNEIILEF